jgi:hypothetical protein
MGADSPEQALILLVVAAAAVVVALLIRRGRSRPPAPAHQIQPKTPAADTPAVAPVVPLRKPDHGVAAPPVRVAVPQSAPRPSYAAIAAAHVVAATPAPEAPAAPPVDYTGALSDIAPDASYTAIAIATALGIAGNAAPASPAKAPARNGAASVANGASAESYAAIAAAAAASAAPRPATAPAAIVIDYSDEVTELPPGASYAAIAVAAAARSH